MIKRISLVWKRPELSEATFRALWLGAHADFVRKLPGLREYVIDFRIEGPSEAPDGIATVRFDTREELDAAFATPGLRDDLIRTRNAFAERVEVLFVEEATMVGVQVE